MERLPAWPAQNVRACRGSWRDTGEGGTDVGRDWAWGEWLGEDRKGWRAELCTPALGLRNKAAQQPPRPAL